MKSSEINDEFVEKVFSWPTLGNLPDKLMVLGGVSAAVGACFLPQQFAYSYLLAFMFFLSLCLGSLFLVMLHHLFDAGWSVPIRRFLEHGAFLLPVMGVLFLPIALLAPLIYDWMKADPHLDHALHAKQPLFTLWNFYLVSVLLFAVWTWLSYNLRQASLEQDRTGSAACTHKMRKFSAAGIFLFAFTVTLASIFWMKALQYQWFSTMYGVYYFAASVWVTLATTYLIALVLKRQGPLKEVVREGTFHCIGVVFLAFTVFYAYIHFSQYFLIWNAAIPEETFWYVQREKGTWWQIGMILIFGHFFLPFLLLLRIDAKLNLSLMVPLCIWAWVMHYCDMSFNIMPVIHRENFIPHWLDLACFAFIGGVLAKMFLVYFNQHPPYPQRDPRIAEAMGVYVAPEPAAAGRRASRPPVK